MKQVSLRGSKILTSGKYGARKSESPLISITASGSILLNAAFRDSLGQNKKRVYGSFIEHKSKSLYFVISKAKRQGFRLIRDRNDRGELTMSSVTAARMYGAPGAAVRFKPTEVNVGIDGVKGFFLERVSEDSFVANEVITFEIV